MKIHYQCSNRGKRFQTSHIPGVPDGMYMLGCRAVGDAFYCEDCVKTWAERNGEEFDKQYKNPQGMFAKWWNRTVDMQCNGREIKSYHIGVTGDYVENRTNERRAEMERLTQWIDENRAIPRVDLRRCGHERCSAQLARYEDTGLTPEQIRELKERDTAKTVREADCNMGYYICPACGTAISYMEDGYTSHKFCLNCGQRLKWEE